MALSGVVMGDINAVTAVEHANRRILAKAGAMSAHSTLLPGLPFPHDQKGILDIYVDDLVVITIVNYLELFSERGAQRLQDGKAT